MSSNPQSCKVVLAMSTSVDGVAGGASETEFMAVHTAVLGWQFPLASWRASQGMEGGQTGIESELWQDQYERFGAQIVGRTMFDFGFEPWGDEPPFHAPVFVHTSTPGASIPKAGGTTFHFKTGGIRAVVDAATEAAAGRDVLIAGGIRTARAALAAGVADELILHVAPVILGHGVSLLSGLGPDLPLQLVRSIQGENALHLTYAIKDAAE